MDRNTGKPNSIEDALVSMKSGQWFGFKNLNGNDANKTYANLIIHDGSEKPTEKTITDKLKEIQDDFDAKKTKKTADKASADSKLKALGLTDDEIEAFRS